MRIEVLADERAVAMRAADLVCEAVRAHPATHLGLPTGRTPLGAYAELERRQRDGAVDFSAATAHAIDEFAGVATDGAGTNADFFRRHLHLGLKALHCPIAAARYPDVHIRAFAEAVRFAGGLDLCLLGVGTNGHIAFNEPGSPRDAPARLVALTPESRAAHAEAFGGLARVPERGMTLGVADLLEARALLVLATGAHKAAAVRAAIEGAPAAEVPASWLQGHPDVRWLLDPAAAAQLRRR